MTQYAVFTELADTWDVMAQTQEPSARRETLRECADAIRMIVDMKNKPSEDCPHAIGPFRFCHDCPVTPCPIGLRHCS